MRTAALPAARWLVHVVNAVNKPQRTRSVMDTALGVRPDAWMPDFATQRFRRGTAKVGSATQVIDGARGPRQGGDFFHLIG